MAAKYPSTTASGLGGGVGVSVGVVVGVFVEVGVKVGVAVGVSVTVGVFVGVFVAVGVSVTVGVFVGVSVGVLVGVGVGLANTPCTVLQPPISNVSNAINVTPITRCSNIWRFIVFAPVSTQRIGCAPAGSLPPGSLENVGR